MAGASSDESKQFQSTRELVREFCSYTTTHGVGRLAETKSLFSRLIWTTFIFCAFSMFIYQTRGLFELYQSRPVSTVVRVRHKTKVTFPAVTVCNQNPVKADEIPEDYEKLILKEVYERLAEEVNDQEDPLTPTDIAHNHEREDHSAARNDTDQLRIDYLFEELLIAKLAVENGTKLYNMGHRFKDMVFDCNFRGNDCRNYSKYWFNFWDYRYGNCFTFNGGFDDNGNEQTILKTQSTGPFGGLKLNLFIETLQYVHQLSHTAGARIVIHDQNEVPFPDEEGINLLPGISTSVAIRREKITRVDPFNNGSCKKTAENDGFSKEPYSREMCLRSCLTKAQLAKCGCADARFSIDGKSLCDTIENRAKEKCLDNLTDKYNEGELDCQTYCPVPCSEVVFKTTMSMAEWPAGGYKDTLFNRVRERKNPVYDAHLSDGSDIINQDFLQVRVFFERLNYQELKEHLSYKEVNLLADIGGQLGLWIGISVLTCCEFLELALLLAKNFFKRMKNTRVEVIA